MTSVRSGNAKVFQPSKKGDKKNPLFSKKVLTKALTYDILNTEIKKGNDKND